MGADWQAADGLTAWWSLSFEELGLLEAKPPHTRLGFSAQLKMYGCAGRFAQGSAEFPAGALVYLAQQTGTSLTDIEAYDWQGRTGRRHRAEVLRYLGVRQATGRDMDRALAWATKNLCPLGLSPSIVVDRLIAWFGEQRVGCPEGEALDRLVATAQRRFEDQVLTAVDAALSPELKDRLDSSLADADPVSGFSSLKADPGQPNLDNILLAARRLDFVRSLALPTAATLAFDNPIARALRRRVANEAAWRMRQHPQGRRHALYAVFLAQRSREITDGLIDLLVEVVHKVGSQAKRSVVRALAREIERVQGKETMLIRIAEAATEKPDGTVRDVVFPAVGGEPVLCAILREHKAAGTFERRVHAVLRSSYARHYRRMLPAVLTTLEFRSNNARHRPVLEALDWLKRFRDDGRRVIRPEDKIPIDGVVPAKWRDLVVEKDSAGGFRINRINYEICVLTALRERLRCKEIWVVGADRYRNPDEDLPQDFEERRADYYRDLGRSQDAQAFVAGLKAEMTAALQRLNAEIPHNPKVRLLWRGNNRISITPFDPLPAPPNLEAVKAELERRWPMTDLIDVLTETALRTGFLNEFSTSGDRVILDPDTLRRRLVLCLYGLGTNAGLKRVSAGTEDVSYADLLHVRRLFIHKEAMRGATAIVTNAILATRDPRIWGEAGTACASDSKKISAWDQNLMTEWHVRYNGRGVMIYWHMERQATCIYSQLKRCSSSEVSAMIEGVLRHCTDMTVERHYVDSHGQSEVAFAFCHLLGFELAPRLKAIARQKLYLPEAGLRGALGNLAPILSRAIDWRLIEQQYDEMIKYTAALRHRTAEPEAILRRFAGTTVQHPTYAALTELGKVLKTIFLTRYIGSEDFRREINAGLNVVENWNGAHSFIFFGKGGEIASNRLDDQEISVLALHLLQNCLVYVNTLMLQRVLAEPGWLERMTADDHRGLTPAIHGHINPYGRLDADLSRRIDFEQRLAA
ncbi:Tn3 family transposase [Mesorhizobium sp.]|uniref:Tn3 family transposase n=1 Tax=Mesorhizobium sp. TaxID=1871066 RepID=UPI001209C07D|nr:Tn3 family transposase [Mesorhizobium sp.]TIS62302.1 MAG: Tn3 family transposase [Mesorhizobium sp.]